MTKKKSKSKSSKKATIKITHHIDPKKVAEAVAQQTAANANTKPEQFRDAVAAAIGLTGEKSTSDSNSGGYVVDRPLTRRESIAKTIDDVEDQIGRINFKRSELVVRIERLDSDKKRLRTDRDLLHAEFNSLNPSNS